MLIPRCVYWKNAPSLLWSEHCALSLKYHWFVQKLIAKGVMPFRSTLDKIAAREDSIDRELSKFDPFWS